MRIDALKTQIKEATDFKTDFPTLKTQIDGEVATCKSDVDTFNTIPGTQEDGNKLFDELEALGVKIKGVYDNGRSKGIGGTWIDDMKACYK
eukprot:3719300-Rhodomonas_salina.1